MNDNRPYDLAQIRAEMSPIGQEALDAALARILLAQAQERIRELEKQKAPATSPPG